MWSTGGASIENFIVVGEAWGRVVTRYTPENATVLDIGCGCGRTARVLINNRWITRYVGFDVIPENAAWCNNFIAPNWHGAASFHYFDLYSAEYNPEGKLRSQDFTFPCEDGSVDVAFAASVFTHLLEPDALHYLSEISRVLSDRGKAILSIHNTPAPGTSFSGNEIRIDIDPKYFAELAGACELGEIERIDDLAGQQVFIFGRNPRWS
jgi:SAM-dependent methyltransferase